VIGVDLHGVEVLADLATPDGRLTAIEGVRRLSDGVIDGLVLAAGISRSDPARTVSINYFGVRDLLTNLKEDLGRGTAPGAVAIASIVVASLAGGDEVARACLAGDEDAARVVAAEAGPVAAYRGTKLAVGQLVRRLAPRTDWAGSGIRLNAVAPGLIETPMTASLWDDPAMVANLLATYGKASGRFGRPEEVASAIVFLLGPAASYVAGQVLFVDGGFEATLRPGSGLDAGEEVFIG
jgi:NAD(P)-dependent dehydrogenase (short-subunit alcohol dehydrogenase family)